MAIIRHILKDLQFSYMNRYAQLIIQQFYQPMRALGNYLFPEDCVTVLTLWFGTQFYSWHLERCIIQLRE